MPKVLEIRGSYKILSTKRDYIVINTALAYENHAHFKRLEALKHLLHLIECGQAPASPYMIKAARRLLGDAYGQLRAPRQKPKYSNHRRAKSA